jgi:4-amino-4-deoxy-L-arabinose transferase-like glycosyltransferase
MPSLAVPSRYPKLFFHPSMQNQQRTSHGLIVFLAAVGLFTFALPAREFIGFEPRFALFAQEMLRSGWTLFPHTYLGPYPDYPGASTWVVVFLSRLFGGLSFPIAVLPSAVLSAWTLVLTWRIGTLEDPRWGWAAVLALLGTQGFFQQARTLAIDPYTMALLTTSMWLILRAEYERQPLPVYTLLLLQLMALAVRGPIGLVMLTGVNTLYFFTLREWRQGLFIGLRALAGLIIGGALLLFAAWLEGGEEFVQAVLRMQVIGRFSETTDPISTYLVNSFGNYFYAYLLAVPVLLLCLPGLLKMDKPRQRLILALLVWVGVILIGMSIPATKKARYILPMAPAIALLASAIVLPLGKQRAWHWLQRSCGLFLRFLPVLGLVALGLAAWKLQQSDLPMATNLWTLLVVLGVLSGLAWNCRGYSGNAMLRYFGLATATLISINVLLIEPFNWKKQSSADFVHQVERLRDAAGAELGFYRIGKDAAAVVYMANADTADRPHFYDEAPLVQTPLYLVMKKKLAQQQFSDQTTIHQGIMDGDEMADIQRLPDTIKSDK